MIKHARNIILPLASVVILGSALVACDKGKGGSGGGGGAKGTEGASAIAPAQGGLKRALAAMPKETDIVLGLDFQSMRKSAVFKKYEPQIMEKAAKGLEEFKQKCGFDPMEKLTGAIVGLQPNPGGEGLDGGTFFVRGFEKGPAIECIKKLAAEKAAEGETANIDGDYIEYLENGVPKFRALFIDDTTALAIMTGPEQFADKAALQAAAAAKEGDGLTASAAFVKLLDEVKTGSSLWFLMNGNAKFIPPGLPFKLKAVFGWVNVGGGVDGESRARMEDNEAAAAMVGMYRMAVKELEKTPAGKFIGSVKVSSSGPDVVAAYKFDQKQIDEMVEMAKSSPF